MTRSTRQATEQRCPNCGTTHDVSVFVSGQKIQCACGIRFEVKRTDVVSGTHTSPERKSPAPEGEKSSLPLEIDVTTPRQGSGEPGNTRVASPPPQVPGYTLQELLGRGGMGEVWRATQLSLGREVALKILPDRFAQDAEFVRRFEKEATALAALSHPNIVQIIDRGKAGTHYFFVMELVPGVNLRELIHGKRLPAADAMRIMAQVARAIDAAHERGVVHRDLKPENVLVDPRGHVKIADFGLANIQGERNLAMTATAVAMGTVNYMSPEQRRDAKNVDHRADLYSLGVMVFEVLTGELPLGRFKLPTELVPDLPKSLDPVVSSLLETEPAARPARGLVVAEALESALQGPVPMALVRPSLAGQLSSSAVSLAQSPVAGWKVGVVVLGAMLLTGLGLKWWPKGGSDTPAEHAPAWYVDTDDEVFSQFTDEKGALKLLFEHARSDAGEELNVHSGQWALDDGKLVVLQYGDATDPEENPIVKPRAYVAHRYYSADEVTLEADVTVESLSNEFPFVGHEEPRFAELCFRIKDLQVSVFSMPGVGMRLAWRYFTHDGREVAGNSASDLENLVDDEMRTPVGSHRVRLTLRRSRGSVVVAEASVNGVRFAKKVLDGLGGQVGKVAFGCRNAKCAFANVVVSGKAAERPAAKKLEAEAQ